MKIIPISEDEVNLKMTRGDSEYFTISKYQSLEGVETQQLFLPGDSVTLTVKEYIGAEEATLSKEVTVFIDGKAPFEFLPSDTNDLEVGEYVYDVQLTKADGKVTTIIKPSIFELTGEVKTNV